MFVGGLVRWVEGKSKNINDFLVSIFVRESAAVSFGAFKGGRMSSIK